MKRFPDVMIDIETAGTADDAPIASVGIVLFNRKHPSGERLRLKKLIKWHSQKGRNPSGSTMKWWMEQERAAQQHMIECAEEGEFLHQALDEIREFLNSNCDMRHCQVWANDPDFDCRILNHAFVQAQMGVQLHFWTFRSVRTMKMLRADLNLPEIAFNGVKHDCLADADYQTDIVQQVHRGILG